MDREKTLNEEAGVPDDWSIADTAPIVPGTRDMLAPRVAVPPTLPAQPPQLGNYFAASLPLDIQHDGLFIRTGYQTAFAARTPLMPVASASSQSASVETVQRLVIGTGGGGTVVAPGMLWKSTWNDFANYKVNDVVLYSPFLYVAIAAGTNMQPDISPTFWVKLAGPGTVTSVGLALPAIFTVSGSPVTATGTLTAVLAVQTANTIFAGPATGAPAIPTFRVLVIADIPNLPASIITTGQLALARGGTNADLSGTGGASQVLRQSSVGAAVTVSQLAASDLSNGTVGSGAVVLAASPTLTGTVGLPIATLTGKVTNYNSIATVDGGVPSELGHADLTGQTALKAATTLYTPVATGRFRISVYLKVTTAASVSSVLGGVTITYTDGTDSVAQSVLMALADQTGVTGTVNAGNSTVSILTGTLFIYAKTGVAIQYAIAYTSSLATEMAYAARVSCEAL